MEPRLLQAFPKVEVGEHAADGVKWRSGYESTIL